MLTLRETFHDAAGTPKTSRFQLTSKFNNHIIKIKSVQSLLAQWGFACLKITFPLLVMYSLRQSAIFWGIETISLSFPLLGVLRVSLRSSMSAGVKFKTSPILIPPRAINSRMRRFLGLMVGIINAKDTSSGTSWTLKESPRFYVFFVDIQLHFSYIQLNAKRVPIKGSVSVRVEVLREPNPLGFAARFYVCSTWFYLHPCPGTVSSH